MSWLQFADGIAPARALEINTLSMVMLLPLIVAMYVGKYLFRFDDAILLGAVSGARTTTASLGMVNDIAKSQIPGLGYTVTYAVGNTLLTIWGMVLVILLS